ncbi:phage tail assembly protein [Kaistia sp. MMO-174]|uniref:phage tail assembly protein n=1 Tax=Kaistia sp. MMO-174 TaxID=3081256 RepID=UPI00301910D2
MTKLTSATHTLPAPIEVGGKSYVAITLYRPRTGEIRKLHRSGAFAKLIALGEKAENAENAENAEAQDDEAAAFDHLSIYDDIVPVLAVLARVDEAVIDALDPADTNKLIELLNEVDFLPL